MRKTGKHARARHISQADDLVRQHLLWGWGALLCFLSLGLILEAFHGLKASFYLNVSNETRRLMWTLAHAHGTLLGLIHIVFALTVRRLPEWPAPKRLAASRCLAGATLLLPAGFLLGGVFLSSDHPGLPVALVPTGGILLLIALFLTSRASHAHASDRPDAMSP